MKTLYLDCGMGAAGDMLTAALLELLPDRDVFLEELNGLGIPNVTMEGETVSKCGIRGTHFSVKVGGVEEGEEDHEGHGKDHVPEHGHGHNHEHIHEHGSGHPHQHRGMHEIEHMISHLKMSEKVKQDVLAVYGLIAEAESHVHGVPVSEIHFHEVGTMDAVADIAAACLLMDRIGPDEVVVSPVHVGSGEVRCAHGILPVPAPATAYLLREIPIYGGSVRGELCTPTGAAILKYFASRFGEMPVMKVEAIGYGMGEKDFDRANCVRAMLGDGGNLCETVTELSCNVDDMTAEEIGFAMERLFENGAAEVYTVPIGMKKSRPGTLIRVICKEELREEMIALLFRHTTTLGIREAVMQRYVLEREQVVLDTPYGKVQRKDSTGYGVKRYKYEYEDLSRIAREKGIGLKEARKLVEGNIRFLGK